MDNTNVRVITQEPTTSTIASSFIRSEQVRISVTIDQMTPDWIGIHAQAGDYSVVQSIYMPLQAAESVAFQIQSLVQERLRGNP